MNESLNTRQLTVLPELMPAMPPRVPAPAAAVVRLAAAPCVAKAASPADVRREPTAPDNNFQPDDYRPGVVVSLIGHVTASLAGLAIAFQFLCWLRPTEFNWSFLHSVSAAWIGW